MASPIEHTPVIKGEDAKRFQKVLLESLLPTLSPSEIDTKKKEMEEWKKNYKEMVSASNGVFY
jgi:hypothetical protein